MQTKASLIFKQLAIQLKINPSCFLTILALVDVLRAYGSYISLSILVPDICQMTHLDGHDRIFRVSLPYLKKNLKKIIRTVDLRSKVRSASGMTSLSIGHSVFKIRDLAFESLLSRLVP